MSETDRPYNDSYKTNPLAILANSARKVVEQSYPIANIKQGEVIFSREEARKDALEAALSLASQLEQAQKS